MDERIFEEVARQLKSLHNASYELIKEGRYDEAGKLLISAGEISSMTGYRDGMGMSCMSLSNLEAVKGDCIRAMEYARASVEYLNEGTDRTKAEELLGRLSVACVKLGMEKERKGCFDEALSLYIAALPNLEGKRREAVEREICLLRGVKYGQCDS